MDVDASSRFSRWLFEQLNNRDMSYRALGRRVGVHASTVGTWVSGRSLPDPPNVRRIAQVFDVDPDFVLDLTGHRPQQPQPTIAEYHEIQRKLDEIAETTRRRLEAATPDRRDVMIRVVGRVPATVGRQVTLDALEQSLMPIGQAWIGDRSPEALFIVIADGDCLEHYRPPVIDGDEVLCRALEHGEQPRNGQVVFVRVDGEDGTLKVWQRKGNSIELQDGDGNVASSFSVMDDFSVFGVMIRRWSPELVD